MAPRLPVDKPHRGKAILFVHDLRATGVVRNTLAIAGRVARDYEVTLVVQHQRGLLADGAQDDRYVLRRLFGARKVQPWTAARKLRSVIRETRPDVLLSCGNLGHWVARLACIGLKRPRRMFRISNSVDAGRHDLGLRRLGAHLIARGADHLFLVGGATGASTVYARAIARGRAEIVPNGVDRARAIRLAAAPRPDACPGDDIPMLLAIGRLVPQKDFSTLVRAAARAGRERSFRLVILGDGTEATRGALRRLATAEGLDEDRFRLPGETDNVFAWLARASAFALPSRWEGSSMALLEAMALDVPVIAARQAGDAAHVLLDGRYGALFDAGDVEALAAAILRQLSADAIRPNDRAARFDIADTLDRYAAGIDREIAQAQSGRRESSR